MNHYQVIYHLNDIDVKWITGYKFVKANNPAKAKRLVVDFVKLECPMAVSIEAGKCYTLKSTIEDDLFIN